MVSPVDKNGGDVDRDFLQRAAGTSQSGASVSGDAVAYTSRLQFGDVESGAINPTYTSRRAAAGWATEGVTPPIGNESPQGTERPNVMGLSVDLSKAFSTTSVPLTADAPSLNGSWGLYMRSSGQAERYTLLSDPWTNLGTETTVTIASTRFEYEADTPDSRHVVFNSTRQLLDEAPADGTSVPTAVYEWVNGTLRLVSVPPPDLLLGTTGGVVAGGGTQRIRAGALHGDHVISRDGRRVFFTAPLQGPDGTPFGRQLMVREDGAATRVVSRSERAGDPPFAVGANPEFWSAKSGDGSMAIFRSASPLTTGAGTASLYRWDATAPEGQRLIELSRDPLGTPAVAGPAAVSDDARRVYFVAGGVLDPSVPAAPRGAPNLYLWKQGEGVRYIATVESPLSGTGSRDSTLWRLVTTSAGRAARVSGDGERLLFASSAQLDPSYDITEPTPEACGSPSVGGQRCRQIYLYDARADRLTCITCVEGAALSGDADLFGNADNLQQQSPLRLPRNLSADGSLAFFETARRLDPRDDNNALDVYEWRDADLDGHGELHLISPGQGATDSKFLDASPSGDNVFFTTREKLVGIDTDNQVDAYDARVGGGIPAQNPTPSRPCSGEECQGTPSGAPVLPGAGSTVGRPGNPPPARRPSFSVARLSSTQRARLARGRRVAVRVQVSQAGKVSLTARARLGGRKRLRTVARASKTAPGAGTIELNVRLSTSARRALARKRTLTIRMAVRFTAVKAAKTSTLRLRAARPSAPRSTR